MCLALCLCFACQNKQLVQLVPFRRVCVAWRFLSNLRALRTPRRRDKEQRSLEEPQIAKKELLKKLLKSPSYAFILSRIYLDFTVKGSIARYKLMFGKRTRLVPLFGA